MKTERSSRIYFFLTVLLVRIGMKGKRVGSGGKGMEMWLKNLALHLLQSLIKKL